MFFSQPTILSLKNVDYFYYSIISNCIIYNIRISIYFIYNDDIYNIYNDDSEIILDFKCKIKKNQGCYLRKVRLV